MKNKLNMNDYILQIPEMIVKNTEDIDNLTQLLVKEYLESKLETITLVASGSSYNASVCAKEFMKKILGVNINILSPYTFENDRNTDYSNDFICLISQSGCSTNAIRALEKVRKLNKRVIGITSNLQSDFNSSRCDIVIDYKVGIETVGYVTKGVVGLILFLMLFSLRAALENKKIDDKDYRNYLEDIKQTSNLYKELYDKTKRFIEDNNDELLSTSILYFVSSGANLGTCLEAQLKVGETAKIPCLTFEIEEYIHGPNLQLNPSYSVFFIENDQEEKDRYKNIFEATIGVTEKSYIITGNENMKSKNSIFVENGLISELSPIYNLCVFEYLAFWLAESLNKWDLHPLVEEMEKKVKAKSEKYKN